MFATGFYKYNFGDVHLSHFTCVTRKDYSFKKCEKCGIPNYVVVSVSLLVPADLSHFLPHFCPPNPPLLHSRNLVRERLTQLKRYTLIALKQENGQSNSFIENISFSKSQDF